MATVCNTYSIEFVYENDGRFLLLSEREGVPDQLSSVSDEHLYELRSGQFQEGGLSLGGTGPG